MSWKLRRAHYYSSQKGSGIDSQAAKWTNFWLLIGIALIFIFLVIASNDADIETYPILGFLSVLGLLSLLGTPFLLLIALLGGTFGYGLPNIARGNKSNRSQKVNRAQGEHVWNEWIEADKKKKEKDFHKENLDKWLEKNKGKKIFNRKEAELRAMDYHLNKEKEENEKKKGNKAKQLEYKKNKTIQKYSADYYQSEEYKEFCRERTRKYNELIQKGEIQGELKDTSVVPNQELNVFYGKNGGRYRVRYNKNGQEYRDYF